MKLKPIRVLATAFAISAASFASGQALAQAPAQAPAPSTAMPPAMEPTGGATNSVQQSVDLGVGGHNVARAAAITVGVVAVIVALWIGSNENGHSTSAPTATQ